MHFTTHAWRRRRAATIIFLCDRLWRNRIVRFHRGAWRGRRSWPVRDTPVYSLVKGFDKISRDEYQRWILLIWQRGHCGQINGTRGAIQHHCDGEYSIGSARWLTRSTWLAHFRWSQIISWIIRNVLTGDEELDAY